MSDTDEGAPVCGSHRMAINATKTTRELSREARTSVIGSDSSDSDDEIVRETAPPFQDWHDTWDDCFANLRAYRARTSQLYRIRSGTNVAARNEKIKMKKKWKNSELVPETFGDYYKKLLCTHVWGKKPREDGQRTGHNGRGISTREVGGEGCDEESDNGLTDESSVASTLTAKPTADSSGDEDSVGMSHSNSSDDTSDVVDTRAACADGDMEAAGGETTMVNVEQEQHTCAVPSSDDASEMETNRLLAGTNRIIRRVHEMVTSDSDNNGAQRYGLVSSGKSKKTYNLAVKTAVKRKKLPVKATTSKETPSEKALKPAKHALQSANDTNMSDSDTNQSGPYTNQLGADSDTNQLGSDTNQSDSDTNHVVPTRKRSVKDTSHSMGDPKQPILRKRRTKTSGGSGVESSGDISSSDIITGKFRVGTSVKSKGRPKIRRKQAREAKRIRMDKSVAEAKALVQGTLVPVKDLSLVRNTMACSFNVADVLPVINSITQVDAWLH